MESEISSHQFPNQIQFSFASSHLSPSSTSETVQRFHCTVMTSFILDIKSGICSLTFQLEFASNAQKFKYINYTVLCMSMFVGKTGKYSYRVSSKLQVTICLVAL